MRWVIRVCSRGLTALVVVGVGLSFMRGYLPSFPIGSAPSASGQLAPVPATHSPSPKLVPSATALVASAAPVSATPPPAPRAEGPRCQNPDALGVARVVEIDTTDGPGFGFEHFKAHDFLNANEIVLTFDDGPWPGNTPAVLAALAAQCTKATFFPIGKHATWHPEILKQVAAAGHSIGSHTWSHADLSKKTSAEAKDEVEKGFSAVRAAASGPIAPFFRFPQLKHPPETVTYLGQRNIAMFSTDLNSFDFKIKKPDQVVSSVMTKLGKRGKGILLMHDFQRATAQALPELLKHLKANGYKVVHLTAKAPVQTLPDYDAMMSQEIKGSAANARPASSVVRTVGQVN